MNEAGKRKIPDVAAEAEAVIQSLVYKDHRDNERLDLKTSQIRKFLAAVTSVTNKIEDFVEALVAYHRFYGGQE
ncbi:hypothetical protein [Mitsuokella multacida]|uniref:hypothetical protein n=1 Tax=Mitsuokella multacida TaxID=52226 RepID=UPI003F7FDF68